MASLSDFTKAVVRVNGSDQLHFWNSSELSWLVDTHGIDDFYVDGSVDWTIRLTVRSIREIFIKMVVRFDQVDLDPVISDNLMTPKNSLEESAEKFIHCLQQYRDPVNLWRGHYLRKFMNGSIRAGDFERTATEHHEEDLYE